MVDRDTLLSARLRLPEYVVHRTFVAETVVLNLQTGKYHGLNPMGGHMLDVLGESADVRAAAERIATEYDQDLEMVEDDFVAFCNDLLDRGLIELEVEGSQTTE
ncbi:MAG TPA: PqqD family protein [Solirubrobacteraceae bacterium]|nr:PqqD family protein [Solirubrobacteraceae bacterium]